MMPAVFDQTTVDIAAKADRTYDFRVSRIVLKFDGFLKVYESQPEDKKARRRRRALDEQAARVWTT